MIADAERSPRLAICVATQMVMLVGYAACSVSGAPTGEPLSGDAADGSDADLGGDTVPIHDPVPPDETGDGLSTTCVTEDEPTYQPYSNSIPQVPLCASPSRIATPTDGGLVDVSNVAVGDPGTCGAFFAREPTLIEIDATAGFPIWVRLPRLTGPDPACATLCDLGPEPTAFGMGFVFRSPTGAWPEGKALAVRVPPPWYFLVANEHAPTPCMDGRPSVLEFSRPLACAMTWGTHFGLGTSEADAPSVDVAFDLVDRPSDSGLCCPYTCAPGP